MSTSPLEPQINVVVRLYQAINVARIHDVRNVALTEAVADLETALAVVHASAGYISLKADPAAVVVFLNDKALRGTRNVASTFEGMAKLFDTFGMGELRFNKPLKGDQLRGLLGLLRARHEGDDARAAFSRLNVSIGDDPELQGAVDVVSSEDAALQAKLKAARKKVMVQRDVLAKLTYARTLVLLKEYMENLRNEELRRYFWQKLQRAAVAFAGLAEDRARDLSVLARVRDADDYTYNHPLNVCILAILLGKKLGLPKTHLALAGLGGLLHGIGKSGLDPIAMETPDAARNEPQRREYARHPYQAVGEVLELRRGDEVALATAVVLFAADGDALPRRRTPVKGHPLAQVVGICEAYDALVTARPSRPRVAPDEAVSALLRGEPRGFSPTLVRVFVSMLGLYPPGSAVTLDTGEVGVVIYTNEAKPRHPVVAILRDKSGKNIDATAVDLAEKGTESPFVTGSADLEALEVPVPVHLQA